MKKEHLVQLCKYLGIQKHSSKNKSELIFLINTKYGIHHIKCIILLQKVIRGYLVRKLKDCYSWGIMNSSLENYKMSVNKTQEIINQLLASRKNEKYLSQRYISKKKKSLRIPNFPSDISENLVKFAFYKKYGFCPNWDTIKGDLSFGYGNYIEVKGFYNGPTSFGPKEAWDIICFVDCTQFKISRFKVYMLKMKNTHERWRSLQMNKTADYGGQCQDGRRPRITFEQVVEQIGYDNFTVIFDGHLEELK